MNTALEPKPAEGYDPSTKRRLRLSTLASSVLFALALSLFAYFGFQKFWLGDDGFINIRIVQNLLEGNGFVYNSFERVEAGTSPLWLGCIALGGLFGFSLEWTAAVLGWLMSIAGLAFASFACLELHHRRASPQGFEFPLGLLIYASVPVAWDYATSGLENGLALAWMGGTFWASARALRGEGFPWTAAILTGLGPLVRPDLALMSVAFFLPLLVERTHRARLGIAAVAGVLPGLFQIFRMGYFAAIVPNTAIAKSASEANWNQGFHFFHNLFGTYWLYLPVALALPLIWSTAKSKPRRLLVLGVFFASLLHMTYVIRVGGGFMHGRLLLAPFAALLLPVMMVPIRLGLRFGTFASVICVLWAGFCISNLRHPVENQHGIGDERGWYMRRAGVERAVDLAEHARDPFVESVYPHLADVRGRIASGESEGPMVRIVLGRHRSVDAREDLPAWMAMDSYAIGMVGVAVGTNVHVIDRAGLADPVAARFQLPGRGRPGHEKHMPDEWVIARFAREPRTANERVARQALECGELAEFLRAIEEPMSWSRFWQNFANAYRFTKLRFSSVPIQARDQLCSAQEDAG